MKFNTLKVLEIGLCVRKGWHFVSMLYVFWCCITNLYCFITKYDSLIRSETDLIMYKFGYLNKFRSQFVVLFLLLLSKRVVFVTTILKPLVLILT